MARKNNEYRVGDIVSLLDPDSEEGYEYLEVLQVTGGQLLCLSLTTEEETVLDIDEIYERFDRIPVKESEVRRFLRQEIGISDLTGGQYPYERLICDPPVCFQVEDLLKALRVLRAEKKKDAESDLDSYLDVLSRLESRLFRLENGLGAKEEYPGLTIWEDLDDVCSELMLYGCDQDPDEPPEPVYKTLDRWIGRIESELSSHSVPLEERTFNEKQKVNFISRFEISETEMDMAGPVERQLYKRFVDELCEIENPVAMRAKAYGLYGGNAIYPCDWKEAEKLFLKLFERTDDPFIANTLGYLYYYGRCTDGTPDYGKAFYYYSAGAAGGVTESLYKQADLFRDGKGVPRNLRTCRKLLSGLYAETMKDFLDGDPYNKLADVAVRLASLCLSDDTGWVPGEAYRYALEADFSIRARRRILDFIGDESVERRVRDTLSLAEKACGFSDLDPDDTDAVGDRICQTLSRNGPVSMEVRQLAHEVSIRLIADSRYPRGFDKLFVTVPEFGFCGYLTELTVYADEVSAIPETSMPVDNARWENGRLVLFYADLPILSLIGDIRLARPGSGQEKTFEFASVSMEGKAYRVLTRCSPEIREGDSVRISTEEGMKNGIVFRRFRLKKYELSRPDKDYPQILCRSDS